MSTGARFTRVVPYALIGTAAGYLYYVASNIQYHAREGVLGPDFWPRAILAFVIAISLYKAVMSLLPGRHGEAEGLLEDLMEESAGGNGGAAVPAAESHPWILLGGMVVSVLYVWSIPWLGFFTATVPFLAAFMALGGYRRWGVIATVSVTGTLILLFFFMKVVYVSLPIGREPFAQVTLLLMKVLGIR